MGKNNPSYIAAVTDVDAIPIWFRSGAKNAKYYPSTKNKHIFYLSTGFQEEHWDGNFDSSSSHQKSIIIISNTNDKMVIDSDPNDLLQVTWRERLGFTKHIALTPLTL